MESTHGRILMVVECWGWQWSNGGNGVERIIIVVVAVVVRTGEEESRSEKAVSDNSRLCCVAFLRAP